MYGGSAGLDDLAERLRQAIAETLAARAAEPALKIPEPRMKIAATTSDEHHPLTSTTGSLPQLHELLREDDRVTFNEELKLRVRAVADFHEAMARQNETQQPSAALLEESAADRYALTDALVQWFVPALEYRPDWCERGLKTISEWWSRHPTEGASGFTLWINFHQAWVHPTLSTLLAVAVAQSEWVTVERLLRLRTPDDAERRGDAGDLMIGAEFTWPDGLGGNSTLAFEEWLKYLKTSTIPADTLGGNEAAVHLACGGNLTLGLARCVYENKSRTETEDVLTFTPHAVATFAQYFCERIRWAASRLDASERAARALGADSREDFRKIAREMYPRLIGSRDQTRQLVTCHTWAEAAGRA
jgi:hypothetical protein